LDERRLGMIADSVACADKVKLIASRLYVIFVCLVA